MFQTIIEILMVGQSRRNIGRYKRLLPHIRTACKKKKQTEEMRLIKNDSYMGRSVYLPYTVRQ